jgi:hypothetical protein
VAIRTIRLEISCMILGRPGRVGVNVHFRAISCRCHRWIVSGVTMIATCRKTRRSSRRPFRREASALVVGQPEAAPLQLPLEDAVFLDQVFETCCWWRLTHPARVTSSTCKRATSAVMGRSYRASSRTR